MDLTDQFRSYLYEQGLSDISVKNYSSDINKFTSWIKLKTNKDPDSSHLTSQIFNDYNQYLLKANLPNLTVKRYLSSLRKFGQFLKDSKKTKTNLAANLLASTQASSSAGSIDIKKLTDEYGKYLVLRKLSPVTIKNYLADTNQFLVWLGKNN